jgi:hypothetical protein
MLFDLLEGPVRFNELQRQMRGITSRLLTKQLRELEEDGLVLRTAYHCRSRCATSSHSFPSLAVAESHARGNRPMCTDRRGAHQNHRGVHLARHRPRTDEHVVRSTRRSRT